MSCRQGRTRKFACTFSLTVGKLWGLRDMTLEVREAFNNTQITSAAIGFNESVPR